MGKVELLPTATFPKARLAGFALQCPVVYSAACHLEIERDIRGIARESDRTAHISSGRGREGYVEGKTLTSSERDRGRKITYRKGSEANAQLAHRNWRRASVGQQNRQGLGLAAQNLAEPQASWISDELRWLA